MSLRRARNLLLTTIRRDNGTESANDDFAKGDILADLNRPYANYGIEYKLEGKDFDQMDSVLSFITSFVGRPFIEKHHHPIAHARTNVPKLPHLLNHNDVEHKSARQTFKTIQHHV